MSQAFGAFKRVLQGLMMALAGLVLLAVLAVVGSRMVINQELETLIERVASESAGVAVEVGAVRGAWWSGLTLHDVVLHERPDPGSPVFATVPLVQVEYSLLSMFGAHPRPVRLDLYHPSLRFVIQKNHLANFQPRVLAPHEQPAPEPVPPVDLVFHGGSLSYGDEGARRPFTAEVGSITGTGKLRGFALELSLQALREADVIRADVRYDLQHPGGEVHATASGVALPYWLDRFAYAPEFRVTGGKADLDVTVAWRDPLVLDELEMRGTARLHDATVAIKNVQVPLERVSGLVAFNQDQALVQGVKGRLAGMPLALSGTLHRLVAPAPALGIPDPALALTAELPTLDLARMPTLFKAIKDWRVSGEGRLVADIGGTLSDPRVALRGAVPLGAYGREPIHDFVIRAEYRTGRLDVPHFQGRVAGGEVTGHATWLIPADERIEPPYDVAGTFQRLDLAGLIARNAESPLPVAVTGQLSGSYHVEGAGERVSSELGYQLTEGTLAGQPIRSLSASYRYATPRWAYPRISLDWGATQLEASITGADDGSFELKAHSPHAELSQLARLAKRPPPVSMAGQAAIEGVLRGRGADPASWSGSLALRAPFVKLGGQPVRQADLTMAIEGDRLRLARGEARVLDGALRLTGAAWPLIGPKAFEEGAFALEANGMRLSAVAGLPDSLRALSGTAGAKAALTLRGGQLFASGEAAVERLAHGRWGRLDAIEARFRYAPDRLSLLPLVWRQGAERISASGDVWLGAAPRWDLKLEGERVQIATLLGAVHWPEVVTLLNWRPVGPAAPLGPARQVAELPAAPPSAVDLAAGLRRWLAYRKDPLDRPPPAPPVLPFWEGTRGRLSFEAHLQGPVAAPAVALTASATGLDLFNRHLEAAELVADWDGARLMLPTFRLKEHGRTVLTAGGAFSDRPEDRLVVQTHGLDLGWTDRMLSAQRMRLAGRADLRVELSGPAADPSWHARGTLAAGSFERSGLEAIPYEQIRADVESQRGQLTIREATLRQAGHEASLTGSVPIMADERRNSAPLALALRLQDDNLAIVNLIDRGSFDWQGGQGEVVLRLTGTLAKPSLGGHIHLQNGRVKTRGMDQPVEGLEADIDLSDRAIAIKALKGRYGGGDVAVTGEVFWDQLKPERLELAAVARPFRMRLPHDQYDGMLEADVKLTGTVAQPLLGGSVSLWDGTVQLKDGPAPGEAGPPNPLRMNNLNVSLGPNLRIKNPLVDLVATTQQRQGYLRLDGPMAAPRPRGVVIIESGTIRPLNNTFKIVDGRVEFLGESVGTPDELLDILAAGPGASAQDALNARLDIQARTTVYDFSADESVEVTARVTGSMRQMEMRFSSEPIRSEQEILDILSKKQVLAGTFSGRLDGGQVILKEVGGLVSSNLEEFVSPFTLYLRTMLNLHTLRFELVSDYQKNSTQALAGFKPALVLETRPLWERLSLGTRLVAGEFYDTTPTVRTDNTYFNLNFRLNRRLGMEYKIEPYLDQASTRTLNHTLGVRAQYTF